jgi:class 3 adenylate cyclase/predicted ATPase
VERGMDVGGWLRGLGLDKYGAAFRENGIDEHVLRHITAEDLREIGVETVGDRRKLLAAIAELAVPSLSTEPRPSLSPAARPKTTEVSAERRPITVMFCDLVGSTSLAAKLDAEDWRDLVNAYLDEATKAVTGFGGHVLKRLGDGLMALFGYPQAQENDAERAVRAALAVQRALVDINARNAVKGGPALSARIGLETGPVVVEAGGEVFGDAPNIAARVQGAADPGSVLITTNVQRQVAGLFVVEERGPHELKGASTPVTLYRVVRASGGRRFGARALTPLVGREEELDLLRQRWDRAACGEGQFALVVGEPGIGKSRLIAEFHAKLGETPHTFVEWSSSQLLQNTPLHPIAEWGRQRFGADEPADRRLADLENTLQLIGLDPNEHAPLLAPLVDIPLPEERAPKLAPEELRRRQLAALTAWLLAGARSQPIVFAFEDLHWADPTSLDLLQALTERGRTAPLFIIATARPEFRAPWNMRSHHCVISLSPLGRTGVAQMVSELAARHALSKEVIEGVSDRTGGVPLYVEEVARLLLERGDAGGLQAIPPTLQQSLAARLDRLGDAREVAQIGAVLGRDFPYSLLRAVGEVKDPALHAALDRLVGSDLLIAEGAGQEANYRFKHALIQDAAYDSLLKSRRQALHRSAAELLCESAERAAGEPEVIAHHFTQAGLDDQAIEWWGKAGDQALRRSAFQEAIAHLGKAIAMADKAAGGASSPATKDAVSAGQRLKLQTDYGQAVMWAKGFGAEETTAAFARAQALAGSAEDASARFAAYDAHCQRSFMRGEYNQAREMAEIFLREAETEGRATEAGAARRMLGFIQLFQGNLKAARSSLERSLADYVLERDHETQLRFSRDTEVTSAAYLAVTEWHLGEVERARQLITRAVGRARELGHAAARANALFWMTILESRRGDAGATILAAQEVIELTEQYNIKTYADMSRMYESWAHGRQLDPEVGAGRFSHALTAFLAEGNKVDTPSLLGLLAELEARSRGPSYALARIDEGLKIAAETGERLTDSYLHRLRGDILLKRSPADPAPAEDAYRTAIAIAKQQGARSYELLASLSLTKLYRSTARPTEAHAVLAPAVEGFSPTPEMPEIAEAHALLAALEETGEVKAETARRQRLTQLQVSYGNALIAARGHTAPETTEAFAKVREFGAGTADVRELAAADYGLWVASYGRGELPPMRVHSAAFLEDVAARPDSVEASVAHRVAGSTHWFAGEYREAREHLERAVALFHPGRDDDVAFRFGQDAGVAATLFLAIVLWVLGDVARAVALAQQAHERIEHIPHVNTRAYGKLHMALFELIRGEVSRAVPDALELGQVARENDLPLFRALAVFLEAWTKSQSVGSADAREEMSRAADVLRERNIRCFDGPLKLAHAQEEARLCDPGRAISIIDDAMADFDRRGHRAMDAELHRLRGEILLKRNPANPGPAEEELKAAIAAAQQQGARSFELRAALCLAKLYQSTGRLAEGHTVLAPALKGLSPTPEMPEIAEAQALIERLA